MGFAQTAIASDNSAGALTVYKQLWDYLEQTFDIEPLPTTQALVVSIRSRECLPSIVSFEQLALSADQMQIVQTGYNKEDQLVQQAFVMRLR